MKKIFIVLAVAFFTNNIHAATVTGNKKTLREERKSERITLRKLRGQEVSYQSQQHFDTRFSDATNVSWTRQDYFDVVHFTEHNKNITAYYDTNSQLVGVISPSSVDKLPVASQNYINKHYKDYTIQKVIFYDDNEANPTDMILYGDQFEDSDSYFAELSNGTSQIVLHIFKDGNVDFFKKLS